MDSTFLEGTKSGDHTSKPNAQFSFIPIETDCIDDLIWELKLKYNDLIYHVMVEKNKLISDYVEDQLLRELKEAQDREDIGGMNDVSFKIAEQFRQFIYIGKQSSTGSWET